MSARRKKKIQVVEKPLRYFISSLNTPIGNSVVEALFSDTQDLLPTVFGSISKNSDFLTNVSSKVTKIIDTTKLSFLAKLILDCDVIIYDLTTCDPNEVEYAIKTLKFADFKEEKIIICISNVLVWAKTSPKEKKENDEPLDLTEEEQEEPDTEQEDKQINEEDPPKKIFVPFLESDYTQRKSSQNSAQMKSLETLCLSAGNSKPNLKTYIVCSGLLYGQGELILNDLFRKAWFQNPNELSYYGEGRNRIPMIHIKDLAEFVKKTVERPPKYPYLFAIDYNKKSTQKSIIQAISSGLGTGKIKSVPIEEIPNDLNYKEFFLLNVRMRPSRAFVLSEEEIAAQEEEENAEENEENQDQEKINKKQKFKFNWHCKDGFQKNIVKITEEYNKNNILIPNRIFITGPPAAGKTYFGKLLSEFFNIPHIKIEDLCKEALELPEGDPLGDRVKEKIQEVRDKLTEEAQEKLEKQKEIMEKKGIKVPENMEVDPNQIKPRIPDDLIFEIYKKRLFQNDCQSRGFVLEGFPKTYEQAKGVFMQGPKEGDEEIPEENKILKIEEKITPSSIIFLDSDDEILMEKLRNLPENNIQNTHYNEPDMIRRLKEYRKLMDTSAGEINLIDFFNDNNLKTLKIQIKNKELNEDIFNKMIGFIERNGKFKNFQTAERELEMKRIQEQEKIFQKTEENTKKQNLCFEAKENEKRLVAEEEYKLKMEDLRKEEKKILDTRSLPLREYLNNNVVPFISEGLAEIYKKLPDDPVDFLAEYLFKRSLDVKFADPKVYLEEN